MPFKAERTIDKIARNLYRDKDEACELTSKENEIRQRLMLFYTHWHDFPSLTDRQMIEYIKNTPFNGKHIEERQAYRDLHNVKILLGYIQNASKEWHRYTVIETCKKAIQIAEKKKDVVGMVIAADKIGKYTKCDQDDVEGFNPEDFIPPELETTNDIKVLDPGLYDPDIDAKRRKLRAKFKGEQIEDADFEEL